ncbi:hypothetical protein [Streptomyces sp. NPDC020681]|uniref:hypothetical protein n=1 Tax=Streptomyces sp. NPDC020681 TaxID=3365083 RepID=UPI0037B18B45
MTGTELHNAMLGGTSCPESVTGQWSFFSSPTDAGLSVADASLSGGDTIALTTAGTEECLLSAQVRRDEQGFNLCLVQDPDSGCSTEELLRPASESGRNQ